ncbi:hypothetical protein [Methylobacterium radiotolerans]
MKPSLRVTLDALARAGMAPGARLPAGTPALSAVQPAGNAPQGALPSQARAGNAVALADALNAAHGLRPGANPAGPFVAANRPAVRGRGVSRPHELADKVNAEAGLRPGANVSPEFVARFAAKAEETV